MNENLRCLNCDNIIEENFCPKCGQKASTKRITIQGLITSVINSLSNIDKGFLFNLKHLTLTPRKTIQDYIDGKRKDVFKPVQYAIIAVTLLTLADQYFATSVLINTEQRHTMEGTLLFQKSYNYGRFIHENLKYLWFLNVFFFSIPTYFFFKRYNFAEHLAINAFVIGHVSLITALALPITGIRIVFNPIPFVLVAIMYMFIFSRKRHLIETGVISLLSVFVGYVLFFLVPFLVLFPFL
ncbi:MAG: DUF3667 domain-containing protein [Bacteroidota bacterium]